MSSELGGITNKSIRDCAGTRAFAAAGLAIHGSNVENALTAAAVPHTINGVFQTAFAIDSEVDLSALAVISAKDGSVLADVVSMPDDDEEDIYAGMTPEAKELFVAMEKERDDLQHRLRSDAGRVSAFQIKINELTRQIQEIRPGDTTGAKPTEEQIRDAMMGEDEEWNKFAQDFPQVAKAIERKFDALPKAMGAAVDSTLGPVKETIQRINESDHSTEEQKKVDAVAEVFPNWTTELAKPEFKLWLDERPPGVQGLSASEDPRDAIELIGLYDRHLVAKGEPSLRKPTDDGGDKDPIEPGVDDTTQLSEIERRRERQQSAGVSVPSKPSGVDTSAGAGDPFEQAFEYFAKKREAGAA